MSGTDELTTLLTADIMPPSYGWCLPVFDNIDIDVKQNVAEYLKKAPTCLSLLLALSPFLRIY